jgi:hypothetical protein
MPAGAGRSSSRGAAHLRSSAAHILSLGLVQRHPHHRACADRRGSNCRRALKARRGRPWDNQPNPSRYTASRQRLVGRQRGPLSSGQPRRLNSYPNLDNFRLSPGQKDFAAPHGEWDCGSAGATSRPFPYPFATRLNQEAIDGRERRRWIASDLNAVMLVLAPNGIEGFRSFANRRANGEVAPIPDTRRSEVPLRIRQ